MASSPGFGVRLVTIGLALDRALALRHTGVIYSNHHCSTSSKCALISLNIQCHFVGKERNFSFCKLKLRFALLLPALNVEKGVP